MHDISRLRVSDDGDCAAAHTVITAARSHHRPWHESPSVAELTRSLRYTLPGERLLAWLARDDEGRPVGLASVWLPDDDNTDKAWLELDVLPRARRQGVGSALLQTLLDAAVEEGRTEAVLETTAPLPGGVVDPAPAPEPADRKHPQDFFGRRGFTVQVRETVRHLELPVPPEVLDRLDPAAGGGIPGYRLVSSAGPIPPALRASYCDLANRLIVDAPSGDIEWQPDTLTPAKLAAHELADDGIGRTRVTSLAVHEQTGQVVAYTQLLLQGSTTRGVIQEGTLVHGDHRGLRLGMAVKIANLRAVAGVAPTREFVTTVNADTNPWMVEINRRLGFRPVEASVTYHRRLPDRREWGP